MNSLELFFYNRVRHNPTLKNRLRNIYQFLFDRLPREKNYFANQPIVRSGYFWGFHDQTPFSYDNKVLLANKLLIPLRMPSSNDELEVGFFYGDNYEQWHNIAITTAWNYHKGCRLQWLGNNEVVYNSRDKSNRLVAHIYKIEGENSEFIDTVPFPIDSASHNGFYCTSFSYYRLEKMMPGYGYPGIQAEDTDLDTSRTGLYINNMKTGSKHLLYSLDELISFEHSSDMDAAYHFVTHSLFSKDDRYVAFLHRWYTSSSRKTRLLVADLETEQLYSSPTSGMVSHYIWTEDNDIIAFCAINGVFSHVLLHTPSMLNPTRLGYPNINSDGHQTQIDENHFITDTYPDKMRMSNMYIVNTNETNSTKLIARVNSPKTFQSPDINHHWACDLHPRASQDGRLLSFDSVHLGRRALCIMDLNTLI